MPRRQNVVAGLLWLRLLPWQLPYWQARRTVDTVGLRQPMQAASDSLSDSHPHQVSHKAADSPPDQASDCSDQRPDMALPRGRFCGHGDFLFLC